MLIGLGRGIVPRQMPTTSSGVREDSGSDVGVDEAVRAHPLRWSSAAIACATTFECGATVAEWTAFLDRIDVALLEVRKSAPAERRHSLIVPSR